AVLRMLPSTTLFRSARRSTGAPPSRAPSRPAAPGPLGARPHGFRWERRPSSAISSQGCDPTTNRAGTRVRAGWGAAQEAAGGRWPGPDHVVPGRHSVAPRGRRTCSMLAHVTTGTVLGVEPSPVRVEVGLAPGLPAFTVAGLAQHAVREGRERVASALRSSGFTLPSRRITVSLAPGHRVKT